MTDEQAKRWLQENLNPSSDAWECLETFRRFLLREAPTQNLVAASTLDDIWSRHIVDSAQLLKLLPSECPDRLDWIDLGAGAGFPGIVVAILSGHKVTLVESRNRRIDYLQRAVEMLDLGNRVTVAGTALERLESVPYSVISARAFAPLPRLFDLAARFSTAKTIWLLPKGRNGVKEWQEVQPNWNIDFRIEPSITDPESGILVGQLFAKRQKPR